MYSDRLAEIWLRASGDPSFNLKSIQEITGANGAPFTPQIIAPTVIFQIPDNGRSPGSNGAPIEIKAEPVPLPAIPQEEQDKAEPGQSSQE